MAVSRSKFVGVDGCPYGWFSVGLDDGPGYEVKAFTTFRELLAHYREARLVLVDIPIGLLEDGPGERACEPRARAVLGARRSSVFPTPPRTLVCSVANGMCFKCANKLSKSSRCEGISRQTYHIMAKIAEVDEIMCSRCTEARPKVREVHPEVCFWALNRKKPMCHRKSESAGIKERKCVLRRHELRTDEVFKRASTEFYRKHVAKDDILDALAAAVTAKLGLGYPDDFQLRTLPERPPKDAYDLPMEMVYVVRT